MTLARSSALHYWSARYGTIPLVGGRPTHTRNSAAKVADVRSEYYDGIINTPRFAWEKDQQTSAAERRAMLLLESARTNSCLWSRDLTNGAWTAPVAATGSVALNAVGLDGTPNSATTLTDSDATASYGRIQGIAIPNDSNSHTVRYWIAKDSAATYPVLEVILANGTTSKDTAYWFNRATGVLQLVAGSLAAASARVFDDGSWWIAEITVANNSTGNTLLRANIYAAYGSVVGTPSVATTGTCVVGHIQVELNSSGVGTSPILTTSVAATRAVDAFYWTYPPPPQAMMIYSKHVERGTQSVAGWLWAMISAAGAPPALFAYAGGSGYAVQLNNGVGSSTASIGPAAASIGDTMELVILLPASGQVQIISAQNGAAAAASSSGGALALPAAWADSKLYVNSGGNGAYGLASLADLKIVKYADVVASTAQGILDELRAYELGPSGDLV